jgi:DHA1 family bicyclomycin/chloramphenicol resistance-like MFS transporter
MVRRLKEGDPGWLFLFTLLAVTLTGPMAIHMFLPAIPAVGKAFNVSQPTAQSAFSVALFTMAFATQIFGSLSDRFGRRPVLLGGLALFTIGAAVAMSASDIPTLLAGRFLQGAGAACGVVLARAILRDVYGLDRLTKAIAYLTAAYVLGPMFAPIIGGALIDAFDWRAEFIFGTVAGAGLVVIAAIFMPETHNGRGRGVSMMTLLLGYRRLLGSIRFCGFAFQPGFSSASFFAHATASSFLITNTLGHTASEFALYFLFFPAGFMLGNIIAGRLSGRVAPEHMIVLGCVLAGASIVLLAVLLTMGPMTALALTLPGGLHTFGQGMSQPNSNAGAIATAPELAGTASGIVVFLQFFLGAMSSQLVAFLSDGTPMPMLIVVGAATTLSLAMGAIPLVLKIRAGA